MLGLAIAAATAAGCGRSKPAGGGPGGMGGAAPVDAGLSSGGTGGLDGAGGAVAPGGGGGAGGAELARPDAGDAGTERSLVLRLVNVATKDALLPSVQTVTRGFSIGAGVVGSVTARLTSATPPDTWCDCDRCAAAGRHLCDTTDFICDGAPVPLAPGAFIDLAWDGRLAFTSAAPPARTACPVGCDHWELAPSGTFVFTVTTLAGLGFDTTVTLPPVGNTIQLSIRGD